MLTNRENYTTYQPYMLLEYNFSFSDSVELTDISITVLEIIRRMNLNKMIDL
ncbi:hypothetical protein M2475_001456, partial [Breznakia sp. PF5-3]|nr:hypothetical protein [Breznakia sp. PM6-1]MDF9835882.1 hypothetical protein [Breznakia sp. PF5-3]MDF9837546.1 hypothetical protein [Breznakia sp. PFB2-8]